MGKLSRIPPSFLLAGAWIIFIVSLFSPSVRDPSPQHAASPMWYVILFAGLAAANGASFDYLPIVIALPIFAFGPILVGEGRRVINWIIRAAFCLALLLVWAVPLSCQTGQPRTRWGCDELIWGFYLYCIAHTVAALYILMPPTGPPNLDAREGSVARGFPVITDAADEIQNRDSQTLS